MADSLVAGPNANMLDPRVGNDKRKALLQMLMQHAHGGGAAVNSGALGSGAPGGISFLGGIRAIPRNRAGMGDTGFTQGSQIASQFLGGMGVGARQPSPTPPGQPMAQLIGGPAGGGASGASSAPNPVAAAPAGAPVAAPSAPSAPSPAPPPSPMTIAGDGGIFSGGPITTPDPGGLVGSSGAGTTNTPLTGAGLLVQHGAPSQTQPPIGARSAPSGLVSLGGGAFFNPATGTVHYSSGFTAQ